MVSFSGWEMPLSYPTGTLAEHTACRTDTVVFDVSHLGTVRVEGPGSYNSLQSVLSNDLCKISPGRAQYTHLLDEADGSVVDDLIVWWIDHEIFDVMPNASNTSRVLEAVGGVDTTAERAVLALQGPTMRDHLAAVCPSAAAIRRFRVRRVDWRGTILTVAGTGYTGEEGVEIAVPAERSADLWAAFMTSKAHDGIGVTPAGLGARDTLRLEAGFPLHGHELGPGITPLQAGLDWVVGWDKPGGFRGRNALVAERERGISRHLVGVVFEGRRPPRAGQKVRVDGEEVGELTSGNFSPTFGFGIGIALVPFDVGANARVEVEARGSILKGSVIDLPFLEH